jgi:hypothetical protein
MDVVVTRALLMWSAMTNRHRQMISLAMRVLMVSMAMVLTAPISTTVPGRRVGLQL